MKRLFTLSLLLGLLVLFSTSSHGQQKQPICGCADIVDEYSTTAKGWISGYHHYKVSSAPICNTKQVGCSRRMVYETLMSDASFGAPTNQNGPILSCHTYPVAFFDMVPGWIAGGSITIVVDSSAFSITNYTRKNHDLHPGKVVREVLQRPNGDIVITSTGVGTGKFPKVNEEKAPIVWAKVADKLRIEVQKRLQYKGDYVLFSFPANTTDLLNSEYIVQPNDLVIVEALSTISPGSFTDDLSASGIANIRQSFNKTKFLHLNHGALICSVGSQQYVCIKNPFSTILPIQAGKHEELDGVIFLATQQGPIAFELNDKVPEDNKRAFLLKLTVVSRKTHGASTVTAALVNYLSFGSKQKK